MFEPDIIKKRMPGLRIGYNRVNIPGENEFIIIFPVKYEIKIMLFMLPGNSFKGFISNPSNTFKFVFDQQTGIDSYFQWLKLI